MDMKSWLPGCSGQAADAVSAKTQVKIEDAPKLLKIPKSECPDIWIRLPKHKMAQIIVQYGRPVRSSRATSAWSSFGRTIMGKAFWESSIKIRLGKSSKLRLLFRYPRKRTILIGVCGRYKTGWKETKHWPNVEGIDEASRFWSTNIIPWPCLFGLYSTRMSKKQGYCRQLQKYVRIKELKKSYLKPEAPGKPNANISSWSCDMEGHAKKCVERYCELANKTTQQWHRVATPCIDDHHFKEEEMESVWRFV